MTVKMCNLCNIRDSNDIVLKYVNGINYAGARCRKERVLHNACLLVYNQVIINS